MNKEISLQITYEKRYTFLFYSEEVILKFKDLVREHKLSLIFKKKSFIFLEYYLIQLFFVI